MRITAQSRLASSFGRVNITSDHSCPCDFEEEDLDRVLWQYSRFDIERVILYRELLRLGFVPPLGSTMFIAGPDIAACRVLCQFLKKSNLSV